MSLLGKIVSGGQTGVVCSLIHAPQDWQVLAGKDVQETDSIPALTTTP